MVDFRFNELGLNYELFVVFPLQFIQQSRKDLESLLELALMEEQLG